MCIALKLTDQSVAEGDDENTAKVKEIDDRKRALLLHCVSERTYDIYEAQKGVTETTYTSTKKMLTDYFRPRKNTQIEYTISGATNRENVSHLTNLSRRITKVSEEL